VSTEEGKDLIPMIGEDDIPSCIKLQDDMKGCFTGTKSKVYYSITTQLSNNITLRTVSGDCKQGGFTSYLLLLLLLPLLLLLLLLVLLLDFTCRTSSRTFVLRNFRSFMVNGDGISPPLSRVNLIIVETDNSSANIRVHMVGVSIRGVAAGGHPRHL